MRVRGVDDVDAFTRLYDRTVRQVYGVVLSVVGDVEAAQQVTESVYLGVWNSADADDPATVTGAELVALAHRAAVEHLRSERTRSGHVRTVASDGPPAHAALVALPDPQRRAIELAYFGGHGILEVARLLDTTPARVLQWIREGLGQVRPAIVSGIVGPGDTMLT